MKIEILNQDQTIRLGNRLWVLSNTFSFKVDGVQYDVPKGFVTDGASCPRVLWTICSPVAGPFGQGAIAHDFFYSVEGPDIGRFKADLVLYHIGRYRGANILNAQAVKTGVNLAGWSSYKTGVDKMTTKSCYNLLRAKATVEKLRT